MNRECFKTILAIYRAGNLSEDEVFDKVYNQDVKYSDLYIKQPYLPGLENKNV
jgi:hypothetical protein